MAVPPVFEVLADPPPLVASVGSPWTMRNITPLVDRVELKFGRTTRGGALDLVALASVTSDELASMVARRAGRCARHPRRAVHADRRR